MKNLSLLISMAFVLAIAACGRTEKGNFNIEDFGAVAKAGIDNAQAIQKAIYACSRAGGGVVSVPAGKTFMCGPIHFKSNVELRLEPNSKLLANPDEGIYRESAFLANEGEGMMWISGKDIENVAITGQGMIDGNGIAFMGLSWRIRTN